MMIIAALITCHNRREKTLACLDRLFEQTLPSGTVLRVYLVDDGSTDGTADVVRARYPACTVLIGDGSLFWCDGMRLAWEQAAKESPDFYFWLNDDTMLQTGAMLTLMKIAQETPSSASIVVGSCCDAVTGKRTYGGWVVPTSHPGKGIEVAADGEGPRRCHTFNGNCALVSKAAALRLGILRSFRHGLGDMDYGLRATRAGIPILLAPGYLATCQGNATAGSWEDATLPRMKRMRVILGRKGLPPGDWWRFLWQHAGGRALLYWPVPYARVFLGL